jgi:hypothetical protein
LTESFPGTNAFIVSAKKGAMESRIWVMDAGATSERREGARKEMTAEINRGQSGRKHRDRVRLKVERRQDRPTEQRGRTLDLKSISETDDNSGVVRRHVESGETRIELMYRGVTQVWCQLRSSSLPLSKKEVLTSVYIVSSRTQSSSSPAHHRTVTTPALWAPTHFATVLNACSSPLVASGIADTPSNGLTSLRMILRLASGSSEMGPAKKARIRRGWWGEGSG